MAKIVHKQKSPLGGDVYLDGNFRVIGYGQKGPFGEEVFLDKDGRYAGWSAKGPGGERAAFMDGERPGSRPVTRRGIIGGWIFLAAVLGLIALFVWMIVK